MNQELNKNVDEIKILIKKKDFQTALTKINATVKFHPNYLYLYGLRAEILLLTKRYCSLPVFLFKVGIPTIPNKWHPIFSLFTATELLENSSPIT